MFNFFIFNLVFIFIKLSSFLGNRITNLFFPKELDDLTFYSGIRITRRFLDSSFYKITKFSGQL